MIGWMLRDDFNIFRTELFILNCWKTAGDAD